MNKPATTETKKEFFKFIREKLVQEKQNDRLKKDNKREVELGHNMHKACVPRR